MKMLLEFAIWEAACPPKDSSRPVLNHVSIERLPDDEPVEYQGAKYNAIAAAADGHILAVVPCQLEDGEVEGLVYAEVLKRAAAATRKLSKYDVGRDTLTIVLRETEVVILADHGVTIPRYLEAFTEKDLNFPDWRRIVPSREGVELADVVSLDLDLLGRLTKAIGTPLVDLTAHGKASPFVIEPVRLPRRDYLAPPFGMQMVLGERRPGR